MNKLQVLTKANTDLSTTRSVSCVVQRSDLWLGPSRWCSRSGAALWARCNVQQKL